MTSLTDETKRDSVRLLLRNLANAIDEGKASYAQLMMKIIVDSSVAEKIAEDIRSAGTTPSIRKVLMPVFGIDGGRLNQVPAASSARKTYRPARPREGT